MRFIRVRKPTQELSQLLGPHLYFLGVPRERSLELVQQLLLDFPENIFIIAVTEVVKVKSQVSKKTAMETILTGEEEPQETEQINLLGFLIAQTTGNMDEVLILQLWLDGKTKGIETRMMDFLRIWSESGGKKAIRVVSENAQLEFYKGFGFKTQAFNMILSLERMDEVLYEDGLEPVSSTEVSNATSTTKQSEDPPVPEIENHRMGAPDGRGDVQGVGAMDAGPTNSPPSNGSPK